MSFKPLQFVYNPPDTINPPLQEDVNQQVRAAIEGATADAARGRNKDVLKRQVETLKKISIYLVDLVKARADNPIVPVNPATNPDLYEALKQVYGEKDPPQAISLEMYSNLLDTRSAMARAQIDLTTYTKTPELQVDPLQKSNIQTIVTEYEKKIVEDGAFNQQLALLLPELKGDQVIFDTIDGLLAEMPEREEEDSTDPTLGPVYDVTDDLAGTLGPMLTGWQKYYAVMNDIARKVDDVYYTIDEVLRQYFYAPIAILLQIIALISTLRVLFHKPKLGEIRASAIWFVYPVLISQVSIYLFRFDQLVQKALSPIDRVLGSLENLTSGVMRAARTAVQQAGQIQTAYEQGAGTVRNVQTTALDTKNALTTSDATAYLLSRSSCTGITGAVNRNVNNGKTPKLDFQLVKYIDSLPKGLASIRAQMSWAAMEAHRKPRQLRDQITKLINRRLISGGDRLETLCTLRSIDACLNIFNSIASELQRMGGSASLLGRDITDTLQTGFNADLPFVDGEVNVIQTIREGSYLSLSFDGDAVDINTADLPEPDPETQQALADSGAKEFPDRDNQQNGVTYA